MRIIGPGVLSCVLVWGLASGCANGVAADDTVPTTDSGAKIDSSTPKDSGTTTKDSGTTIKDSGTTTQDSGTTGCGGQCQGAQSTCCGTTCVDTTSDTNNCGACGATCGTLSCCSSSCVDTMGSDNANCGGCGVVCSGTCMNGACQTSTGCTIDKQSCAHSPCTTGVALADFCDISGEDLVSFVCDILGDTVCCSSSWDSTCVSEAAAFETNSCVGGGC